jgi:hypothetical protein
MWARILISATMLMIVASTSSSQAPCNDLAENPVRFAILGDRTGEHQEGVFGAIVEEVVRLRPDFVMTVGDMIEGYTSDTAQMRTEWDEYFDLVKPISMPLYHVPGNHDITSDAMEPSYRDRVGETVYSFDHRRVHIVVLDNSRWDTQEEFPSEQVEWLRDDLASSADACYTLVFFHQPFWYRTLGSGSDDIIHNVLKDHGVDAVFTGHFHTYFSGEFDGIKYTSLGSSGGGAWESATGLMYHFGWVTIDGEGVHIAPIEKGAVRPWDDQTVEDLRSSNTVRNFALTFDQPVGVADDLTLTDDVVTIRIENRLSDTAYVDTLRWDVPEGWTVEPAEYAFAFSGNETVTAEFSITAPDSLYPLPTVATRLPFAEGKTVNVNHVLEIARTATCVRATEPVTIDGELNESFWQKPQSVLLGYEGELSEQDSAAFCFAYDDDNLYLAVFSYEAVMDSLVADLTERDAEVYTEDAVGLLYQPEPPGGDVYQFYANPLGTVYDQHIDRQPDGYWFGISAWNGEYEVNTTRGEDYFIVEARLPLDQVGATAKSGDRWRVNFRRKQARLHSAAALQVPWDYDPSTFGELVFE